MLSDHKHNQSIYKHYGASIRHNTKKWRTQYPGHVVTCKEEFVYYVYTVNSFTVAIKKIDFGF